MSVRSYSFLHLGRLQFLRDSDDEMKLELDAHVRSGDYLSTLATNLDALTEKLPPHSDEVMALERHVRDLLYVDGHYKIVSKKPKASIEYEH